MPFNRFAFLSCFLVSLFPNSCVSQNPVCNDCCSNYKEINEPRRSTKSVWQPGEPPLCDWRISPDWYRFTSFNGSKMPETKAGEYHCGTHNPIWLKGTHPTVAEGNVLRKACINSFDLNDGCFESFDINIKNCGGDYFVYYLRPTNNCAAAYCAGFGIPCPYGKEGEHPHCYDVLPSSSSVAFTSVSSQQQKDSVLPTTSRKSPVRPSPTVTPTSVPTPTEKNEIEHVFQMKIREHWNDDLKDTESAVYKNLSSQLEQEILKALCAQEDLIGMKVVSFSKGSVIAEFQMMFRKKVAAEDAFADLQKQISDGHLGSLRVDPASLEQISPGTEVEPTKDDKQALSFPVIIGISCGVLFVVFVLFCSVLIEVTGSFKDGES